jgi:hypothetical protein
MGETVNPILNDYLPLVIFVGVAMVIATAMLVMPFMMAYERPGPEKLSAYECGFNAFDDARMRFDVRFYLVSILFIIFEGSLVQQNRDRRLLVHDGVSCGTHRRLCLRMEEGSSRMD